MIIVTIIYWVLAIFFLKGARRREENRWVSALAFCAGLAGFGRDLEEVFIPYLIKHSMSFPHIEVVGTCIHIMTHIPNMMFNPYFFIMVALAYSGKINMNHRLILLIPPVITTIETTIRGLYPFPVNNYFLLNLYVIPYVVYGFYILIKIYIESRKQGLKKIASDYSLAIIASSPMGFQLFSVYIARLFDLNEAFRFNILFLIIITPFLIYLAYSNGFFNTRLRVEVCSREYSMNAMSNSTEILMHALKNRILVMELSTVNIENDLRDKNIEIPNEIETLKSTSNYILKIIEKLRDRTRNFDITPRNVSLKEIINNVLTILEDLASKDNVKLRFINTNDYLLYCDQLHIEEMLCNLIKNSIESIKTQGEITINILRNGSYLTISISDTGCGIAKIYQEKIFQPFFTTKDLKYNFGLGLTYCYQVIHKHRGKIEFISKENEGTTFYLDFPIKYVKELGEGVYTA